MKIFPAFLIKAYVNSIIRTLDGAQAGGIIGTATRAAVSAAVKIDSRAYGRRWSGPDEAINVGRAALYVMRDLVPSGLIEAKDFKRLYKESFLCLSTAWRAHMTRKEFSAHLADAMAAMRLRHAMPDAFRRDWPTLH